MQKLNRIKSLWALALASSAALIAAGSAQASGGHFDVLLYDDGLGNVVAAGVDVDTTTPEDEVVFEGELFGDSTGPSNYSGDEPGFFSFANTAIPGGIPATLPGNAAVTADFLVEPTVGLSLSYWTGTGFGATPNNETLTFWDGVGTVYGEAFGTNTVIGVAVGTTGADGGMDDHPVYSLDDAVPSPGAPADIGATPGVYLAYGVANVAGLNGPSNPFWFVLGTLDGCEEFNNCSTAQEDFNEDIETDIGLAIAYVESNLVPEPSTAWLMAGGLLLASRGARRRQRASLA